MTIEVGKAIPPPVLDILRSRFFSALIAFAVLCGFGEQVCRKCFDDDERVKPKKAHATTIGRFHAGVAKTTSRGDACNCLCHQYFTSSEASAPTVLNLVQVISVVVPLTLAPPEVEPAGIDYPPQLA